MGIVLETKPWWMLIPASALVVAVAVFPLQSLYARILGFEKVKEEA